MIRESRKKVFPSKQTIQTVFVSCPFLDILLQETAESRLLLVRR